MQSRAKSLRSSYSPQPHATSPHCSDQGTACLWGYNSVEDDWSDFTQSRPLILNVALHGVASPDTRRNKEEHSRVEISKATLHRLVSPGIRRALRTQSKVNVLRFC